MIRLIVKKWIVQRKLNKLEVKRAKYRAMLIITKAQLKAIK